MSGIAGLVLRQIRKDALHVRWLLVVFTLALSYAIWLAGHPAPVSQGFCIDECGTPRDAVVGAVVVSMLLLIILIGASVVQADSPTRTDAFWLTQPLPPLSMVVAKLLLILGVITCAVVGGHVITVTVLGFAPGLAQTTIQQSLYALSCLILLVMIVAAVTPSIKALLLTLVCGVVLVFLLAFVLAALEFLPQLDPWRALSIRGDVWITLAVCLLGCTYTARRIGAFRQRAVALFGVVALGVVCGLGINSPMRVLSRGTAAENSALPTPAVSVSPRRYQFQIDFEVKAPPRNRRYRYVNGSLTLLFRDGTSHVLNSHEKVWVMRPVVVVDTLDNVVIDDSSTVRARFTVDVDANAFARTMFRDAVLVVDGFLEEQDLFRLGTVPIAAGQAVQFMNQRFTIRNAPADSSPYYVGLESVSLTGERIFGRVHTASEPNKTPTDSGYHIPWYVTSKIREFPLGELDLRAVFNANRDTVALLGSSPTESNEMIPLSTLGLRRNYDRYSVRSERGGFVLPSPNWISDGTLLISQWRYVSHKSFRVVLPVRAQW